MSEVIDPETGEVTAHALAVQPTREMALQPAADSQSGALMRLIEAVALRPDFDVAKLQAIMDMKRQMDADEARRAYTDAMARFKANPPAILKNKHVKFTTAKGITEYDHATLGHVVKAVAAGLAEHGLSHAWVTRRTDDKRIEVTCTLTHRLGHRESVTLDAAPDESGGKNSIQAVGSAVSYLQRYTLLAITGLATDEADDDGKASGEAVEAAKNNTAAALLESYGQALSAADTDEKCAGIWAAGLVALRETGNQAAQAEFRQMVVARRTALKGVAA